ncbi:MAG: hypothetical protein HY816_14045, partial [Candidatus Wallbacteria bacterium]|nr:hypothetical protein [Candidatus Wallbacteria bacterium]
ELEYVHALMGSRGKEYVYTLTADHRLVVGHERTIEEEIRELGLTTGEELKQKACRRRKS